MLQQKLYTALVTPFNKTGEKIDYKYLESILRMQEDAGNGVLLFGSTGEALSLTEREKREILDFVCELELTNNIIVGVPGYQLELGLNWVEFCNPLPINGYLLTTPIYTKSGILGQTKWFEKFLNKSCYPVMLYNVPSRACVELHEDTVINLKDHPKFVAIKESSGDIDCMVRYKRSAPEINIYCGDDYLAHGMINKGARGIVSVTSCVWPKFARHFLDLCLKNTKNNEDVEKDIMNLWDSVSRELFVASNPIAVKSIMKSINLIKNDILRLPLSKEDLPELNKLLLSNKKVTDYIDNVNI